LYDKPKELGAYKITNIVSLSDKIDLLATMGNGFVLLNNLKIMKKFNTQNEFMADNIYSVIKIDSLLLLGTEKGLISIKIPPLLKGNLSANHLSGKTGLLENKVNFLAAAKEVLWAFSENGISLVPLNELTNPQNAPRFYLKSISVNNSETQSLDGDLNYDQNNVEIQYGFLSFNAPEIFVRFRLSEFEKWTYTQERALRFFSLNPGAYSLQIEFSADNNKWTRAPKNLNFVISPPWWTVWYTQLVISIAVLTAILVYFQLQLKFSKQKQVHLKTLSNHQEALMQLELEAVEKERNRIAKDLHDGVGTSLLTLKMIVGHSVEKQTDKELIEDRFQDTFGELKNIILDLSPPGLDRYGLLTGIQVYVDKIKHTLPVKIELYTFGEEINDKKTSPLLFRIIQELLSNSIKHSKASLIKIQINSFKDLISIIFEDNGQGFDINQKQGVGLGSIKFRIESLKGTYNIQSSPHGSAFTIDIPFSRS
ncbi:MAG TPA: ATP-binding protein, partial [Cyclobacteriaceae bacterium]